MRLKKCFWFVVFLFTIVGCKNQTMHHSYHHISQEKGWNKNETISLNISITDTLFTPYQIYFIVRNNTDYPYQNFSAAVTYNIPDSSVWVSDTLEIILASNEGRWTGSGWAGLYQSSFLLKETEIPNTGNYTFKIKHLLDDNYLKGIPDVGVQVRTIHE